jgi:antitoxin component YwqK of YwqJK toxin-antitoxin module
MNQRDDKGHKQGYWEYFSYGDGDILWSKGNYINDLEEGCWEDYYPNGKIWAKGNYVNGIERGIWEWYDSDGELTDKHFHL